MSIDAAAVQAGPRAPSISVTQLLRQFWFDIYGKEVQDPTTYSYTWMADQMGHICIGIVLSFALSLAARQIGIDATWANLGGLMAGAVIVSLWEYSAFHNSVTKASGLFPLDRTLLRDNAAIAAAYMIMGLGAGFAFHQNQRPLLGVAITVVMALLAIVCAPFWLKQKIIWQKAALPYLYRLSEVQETIGRKDAQELQAFIDDKAPPKAAPFQVIVGGPIGSGRTNIAAAIGTEFAFKKLSVRYLGLDRLLEFAALSRNSEYADDTGPKNLDYWPWSQAQVVIIDNIGPLIAASEDDQKAHLEYFGKLLEKELKPVEAVLAQCHTVWVVGDLQPAAATSLAGPALDECAKLVAKYCQSKRPHALVVELFAPVASMHITEKGARSEFAPEPRAHVRKITVPPAA